jgi:dipeptidyl aminopeptidase/acylaminoacyl peptidase
MRALLRVSALLLAGITLAAQDTTLPVPANVMAEGLPPISASVVEKLRPYAMFSTTRILGWHPSKAEILLSVSAGGPAQLHTLAAAGGASTPVGDGIRTGSASYGPLTTDFLVLTSDGGGTEQTQIYRFDFATRKPTLLTEGKARYGVPSWSPRSNRIAFTSTKRNGTDWDLYVVDVTDPTSLKLTAEMSGQWSVADWSPDDKELLLLQSLPGTDAALWTYNLETGARTALTDEKPASIWRFAQYAKDGAIYAISSRGSDLTRVWRRENGKWTPLTTEGDSVESVSVSPDRLTMAVVFDREAASRLELIDTKTLKVRVSAKLPVGTIRDVRWNPSGSEIGLTLNTLSTNGDVFTVNAKTGAPTRWTTSKVGMDVTALPEPELIRWKSFDGKMIPGVLYLPPAKFTGPRPVMINIHGGPNDAYERPRFQGRSGYFLNEQGIAIIFPNVRGTYAFGRAFESLDDQKKREDAVKDIGALLDWIATQKNLDAKRVMVTGASYGGYMTLAAAEKYPERIRAAFAGSAISNFVTYLETTEPQRVEDRRREYGDERDPEMRKFLLSISPVTHASKIKVPLMIAHGAKDPRVPVTQAQAMYEAAKANNVPVWLVVYQDEGHEIGRVSGASGNFNFYTWITFVEKFLVN